MLFRSWPAGGWTLVGGAAAAANLLMRAVFQNYRVVKGASDERAGIGGEKRLSETIGITGIMVPLSALAYGFGFLPWVVLAYAIVYGGGCLVVVLKLVRKVEAELRKDGAA